VRRFRVFDLGALTLWQILALKKEKFDALEWRNGPTFTAPYF